MLHEVFEHVDTIRKIILEISPRAEQKNVALMLNLDRDMWSYSNESMIQDMKNFLSLVAPLKEKVLNKRKENIFLNSRSTSEKDKNFYEAVNAIQKIINNSSELSIKVGILIELAYTIKNEFVGFVNGPHIEDELQDEIYDCIVSFREHTLMVGYDYNAILDNYNTFIKLIKDNLFILEDERESDLTNQEIQEYVNDKKLLNKQIAFFDDLLLDLEAHMLLEGIDKESDTCSSLIHNNLRFESNNV